MGDLVGDGLALEGQALELLRARFNLGQGAGDELLELLAWRAALRSGDRAQV